MIRGVDGVEYVQRDLTDFPYADDSFDIVFCRLALSYADDEAWTISEVARVLRPGGVFYALVPTWRHAFRGGNSERIKGLAKFATPWLSPVLGRKPTSSNYSTMWATEMYARQVGLVRVRLRVGTGGREFFEILYMKADRALQGREGRESSG
jgi:ubiquinone/menaquinone biosynthesis C-methylase UbiE